jgi:hypothetical protein
MHKLLTVTAAIAALTISATAAQADCVGNHNVMASKAPAKEVVAISTYDGAQTQPVIEDEAKKAEAAVTVCEEGDKNCEAGTK